MTNIVSIKPIGKHQTYDLEVNHPDHQFYLSNGMLTSNSHATLYSMISYQTAYLKANFPIEFLVANLMSEVRSNAKQAKDNINKIKLEIRTKGVKIVPPDINISDVTFKIVDDKTLMAGLDSLKYMGSDAIPDILAKRPFKSFQDLIYRTDSTKVRSTTIQALAASGGLDSFKIDRKQMFLYASDYRAKLRSHMGKLDREWEKEYLKANKELFTKVKDENGTRWVDANGNPPQFPEVPEERIQAHLEKFDYPFPKDKSWTISETFALEEFYMGEGISGTMFDRYPKFFSPKETIPFSALPEMFPYEEKFEDERDNRKANTHYLANLNIRPLEGVVTSIFSFVVKKEGSKIFGQEMARITVKDPWGTELVLLAFPEAWEDFKTRIQELSGSKGKLEPGMAIRFFGLFQWESENVHSLILSDILAYKPSPSLPEDRASKKVKMPRASKKAPKEGDEEETPILELDKEELLTVLEDEVLEVGMSPIEDDEDYSFD